MNRKIIILLSIVLKLMLGAVYAYILRDSIINSVFSENSEVPELIYKGLVLTNYETFLNVIVILTSVPFFFVIWGFREVKLLWKIIIALFISLALISFEMWMYKNFFSWVSVETMF